MPRVKVGAEILIEDHPAELAGLRIGLLANHSAVTSRLSHVLDELLSTGLNVTALFGPEHGFHGDAGPGDAVAHRVHTGYRIPVYSLYGGDERQVFKALSDLDIVLVDFQDVGARFYTYTDTAAHMLELCARKQVSVWVLDRPNPISGVLMEGPMLEPGFESAVGRFPVPVRHGLTIGEHLSFVNTHAEIGCDLRGIRMRGWERGMYFEETGLPWVAPSPGMPTANTAVVYPGTCLLEGTNVSEGRGTTQPFELFGAPWLDARGLKTELDRLDLPGVAFRPVTFTPRWSKFEGERCEGLQVHVIERAAFRPVLTGVAIISATRKLHPNDFAFRDPGPDGRRFFDLLAGTDRLRNQIESDESVRDIAAGWEADIARFNALVKDALIY